MRVVQAVKISKGRRIRLPELLMEVLELEDGDCIGFDIGPGFITVGRIALERPSPKPGVGK